MFKLKKLECSLLHKIDRELLLIEIKGISEAKKHLDKITMTIFSVLITILYYSILSNTNIELYTQLIIFAIFIGIFTLYNIIISNQLVDYEKELYDLAMKKKETEK